jgi:hypothetical protein
VHVHAVKNLTKFVLSSHTTTEIKSHICDLEIYTTVMSIGICLHRQQDRIECFGVGIVGHLESSLHGHIAFFTEHRTSSSIAARSISQARQRSTSVSFWYALRICLKPTAYTWANHVDRVNLVYAFVNESFFFWKEYVNLIWWKQIS